MRLRLQARIVLAHRLMASVTRMYVKHRRLRRYRGSIHCTGHRCACPGRKRQRNQQTIQHNFSCDFHAPRLDLCSAEHNRETRPDLGPGLRMSRLGNRMLPASRQKKPFEREDAADRRKRNNYDHRISATFDDQECYQSGRIKYYRDN